MAHSGLSATEESGELEWAAKPINGINPCKSSETPDKAQLKLVTLKSCQIVNYRSIIVNILFLSRRPTAIPRYRR